MSLVLPGLAQAQNNGPASATAYVVGEGWIDVHMGGADTERWYKYFAVEGRSYCVEGIQEKTPTGAYDGETTVFAADGTTAIGRADDNVQEPGGGTGTVANAGRVCYIAPATAINYLRAGNRNLTATVTTYQWRVVDTTQFCPWFFTGNGFEAFILVKNTTNATVRVTVTLRNPDGSPLGTQTAQVMPNSSFNLQVSDPLGFNLKAASGSVEIAYGADQLGSTAANNLAGAGGPGAIAASVTSLSFLSGVSFDTPMAPRQDFTR